ncbi:MAG: 2-oxoacid:ferredoxin oxidoreductase subunit alpha [Nitrososphaerota archaeon]|nr:2-oxoacid:acceptor oxidoreductase subunit alpha [Nitrososphaerales archaeon]MDW8044657.1 2-oxoacid:ferredoxin oxidoreductase subunit alpha [Nitrososphaerota archaeon]
MKVDFNWMAGGPQGSGVDTAANIFGRACSYGGFYVYGKREYHSNIKGLHSYFHLRVSSDEVFANVNDVDLLAAFDAETVVRHIGEVTLGGGIIVDRDQLDVQILNIPTLPIEFRSAFKRHLEEKGLGDRLEDLLEDAEKRGIQTFRVPYMDLLQQIANQFGIGELSKVVRFINTLTIGISFGLIDYDVALVEKAIRMTFQEKSKVVEMNIFAMKLAYEYAKKNFSDFKYKLKSSSSIDNKIFLSGNQAVAIGKVLGGCRFQTYYPITPAADESEYIEAHEILRTKSQDIKAGVIVLQTEDEISAINMASGAALTGTRASTSTSGPGFSLMVEGLAWAGMNEVPVVITYYQRGAPSTGLPTRHGQDDLRFAIHAGHGEFPRIVLASGDIRECFYDAVNAFNYAERFQLPVIHLIDKALANSYQTFPIFETKGIKIQRGDILNEDDLKNVEYKRFSFTERGVSPRVFLGLKGGIHWYTGDEHNEFGHISEESDNRTRMVEKRMKKLETIDREVPISERINFFGDEDAKNIIVSWGSPKGAILESLKRLVDEGFSLAFLQIRMVHPLPSEYVKRTIERAERVIDVEMNYSGQLGGIISEKTGIPMNFQILKYNGRPMTVTEVYDALKRVLLNRAPKRQVLNYGA